MERLAVAAVILAGCGRLAFDPTESRDGAVSDGSNAGANRAFISTAAQTGGFGGIAVADALCAGEAQAAGLPGTFIAFISDSATSARDRVGLSEGWVMVDGTPIGDTMATMIDREETFNPIDRYTSGIRAATGVITWTGTTGAGNPNTGNMCADWTDGTANSMGNGNNVRNASFTGGSVVTCDALRHFLCLEVGHVVQVHPAQVAGRVVFLSVAQRSTNLDVAAADSACATEATAAGLTGTFRAGLATSTATLASRFVTDARPWVRPDGTIIAAANDFYTGTEPLLSFPNQRADGMYTTGTYFTGVTNTPIVPSSITDTCLDWTSTAPADKGQSGLAVTTNRSNMWAASSTNCSTADHLLCMQE